MTFILEGFRKVLKIYNDYLGIYFKVLYFLSNVTFWLMIMSHERTIIEWAKQDRTSRRVASRRIDGSRHAKTSQICNNKNEFTLFHEL